MSMRVHKAIEPEKLTVKGKKAFQELFHERRNDAIVLPKYDGVYAQITHDGVWSRTGEVIRALRPELVQSARFEYDILNPGDALIGELWMGETEHRVINGAARRHAVTDTLEFVVHDLVYADTPLARWDDRFDVVETINLSRPIPGVTIADTAPLGRRSLDDLLRTAKTLVKGSSSAYDGLILRDGAYPFTDGAGRDGGLYKIKPRASGDFRVLSVVEGKGRLAGTTGALLLDLGGGVTSEVGTGLDDAGRAEFWSWAKAGYPGVRIVEVEYLGVTAQGKLREPAFKSVRWDKTTADVIEANVKKDD